MEDSIMARNPDSNGSRYIKFTLLVIFGIVSMVCACYIFYYIIKFPLIRQRFHNQTLIFLIILVSLKTAFNIPTTFSFFARGRVLVNSISFCLTWQIVDYIFTASIIWCKAIFTLERYVLVFYPHYLRSQHQKLIFHYIPLILINLYLILFYIFVNLFGPCRHQRRPRRHLCGNQCLDQRNGLSTYNWVFNILFPAFVIIFGSLNLLLRVLWTRREMQRKIRNWSKNWKMIIQLLGIAMIYTIVWLPVSIVSLITMIDSDPEETENIANHFYFVTYLCEMAVPIVALFFWPELMQKLRRGLQSNSVAPLTVIAHSTNQSVQK